MFIEIRSFPKYRLTSGIPLAPISWKSWLDHANSRRVYDRVRKHEGSRPISRLNASQCGSKHQACNRYRIAFQRREGGDLRAQQTVDAC